MTRGDGPTWWTRLTGAGPADSGPAEVMAAYGPPALRRWPWALLAAVAGAAAGAGAAVLAHRSSGGAPVQEPHELRAVVDRPAPGPPQ